MTFLMRWYLLRTSSAFIFIIVASGIQSFCFFKITLIFLNHKHISEWMRPCVVRCTTSNLSEKRIDHGLFSILWLSSFIQYLTTINAITNIEITYEKKNVKYYVTNTIKICSTVKYVCLRTLLYSKTETQLTCKSL